jgi:ABC-type transport system involved in multi-copper enzyme maturation permease subunit
MKLSSASFVRRFFIDPLSVKELSGIARRWQTYLGRCLYIGLIGTIVYIFWTQLSRGGAWISPSAYAELGRDLFHSFFALQMVFVAFGGMSAASDMITREIRGGTLGLLALTPLTPWRIVAGKWKAAVIQTSTSLLCGAPVFAVCAYLGGAGLWDLLYSLTLSLACAGFSAAIALLCSTRFRAGYIVSIVSFVLMLGYCISPMILLGISRGEKGIISVLIYSHLLFASFGAASPMGGMPSTLPLSYGWIGATVVTSLLILLLLRLSASRVRVLIRRPGGETPSTPSLDDLRRAPVPPGPRTSKLARLFRGQQGVWERNAILWKELSTRRVGVGTAARVGGVTLVFALLTTIISDGWWRVLVLWFSSLILLLVALANGVSLFVTEREERKWDVLLTTPLGSAEIVAAKLVAGLAGLAPMAAIMVFFWGLMGFAFGVGLQGGIMTAGALGLMTLAIYVLGAFTSLAARHQRAAFSSAFGILLGLLFILPLLAVMAQEYHMISREREFADFLIGCTNPGTYLAHVSEALSRDHAWEGWRDNWRRRELTLAPMFLVYTSLYSFVIVGLVAWMVQRFDRAAGRS